MACFRAGSAPGEVMNIKQEEPLPIKQEPEDDVSDQDEEDDTEDDSQAEFTWSIAEFYAVI